MGKVEMHITNTVVATSFRDSSVVGDSQQGAKVVIHIKVVTIQNTIGVLCTEVNLDSSDELKPSIYKQAVLDSRKEEDILSEFSGLFISVASGLAILIRRNVVILIRSNVIFPLVLLLDSALHRDVGLIQRILGRGCLQHGRGSHLLNGGFIVHEINCTVWIKEDWVRFLDLDTLSFEFGNHIIGICTGTFKTTFFLDFLY